MAEMGQVDPDLSEGDAGASVPQSIRKKPPEESLLTGTAKFRTISETEIR